LKHHTFDKFQREDGMQYSREGNRESSLSKDEQLKILLNAAGVDLKSKNDHLIHSINKVTDLLKSNHELREKLDN
jgi:hypothetical protein